MKKRIFFITALCFLLAMAAAGTNASNTAGRFADVITANQSVRAIQDGNGLEIAYPSAQSGKEYVILVMSANLEAGELPTVSKMAYIAQKTAEDGVSFRIRSRKILIGRTYYAYLASNADSGITDLTLAASFAYRSGEEKTPAPALTAATASTSGITVTWQPVSGVSKYRVYRKTASTSWKKLADTGKTTYTDQTAAKGTAYTYTVRCLSADGKKTVSAYDKKGLTAVAPAAPKLLSAAPSTSGIVIQWESTPGAGQYRVYRKTASTSWKKLADTGKTTYTDQKAVKGTAYTYTVRCLSADGKTVISAYDKKGVSAIAPAAPKLLSAAPSSSGIVIRWESTPGAGKYRVYRKSASAGWKKLADTSKISYTDRTAAKGTAYTYTVRCLSADGKAVTSAYDKKGVSAAR